MNLFANPTELAAGWYAVAAEKEVHRHRLLAARVGACPLVLWREADGAVRALLDQCPHLGAALSAGKLLTDGASSRVQCPFHHWEVNGQGQVCKTPMHTGCKRQAQAFPVQCHHGLCWVGIGVNEAQPCGLGFEHSRTGTWRVLKEKHLRCHPHWVLGNGLDAAHFSAVHGMLHDEKPQLIRDGLGRPALDLAGKPEQAWLARLTGADQTPVRSRFTAWGPGACGLEVFAPIPMRVVFTARCDQAGHALTRVALDLPSGINKVRAMILLLTLLHKDRQILEQQPLRPDFTQGDEAMQAYARLIQEAGMAAW